MHVHKWREVLNAIGEWRKGQREYFRTKGTGLVCGCGEAEFIPANKALTRVLCEKWKGAGAVYRGGLENR